MMNDISGTAPKNTVCLWFDREALEAAQFYADTFPDSSVGAVMRAPGDYPDGQEGDVLTVELTRAITDPAPAAKRAFEAMMTMQKIDIAEIEQALRS